MRGGWWPMIGSAGETMVYAVADPSHGRGGSDADAPTKITRPPLGLKSWWRLVNACHIKSKTIAVGVNSCRDRTKVCI